VATMTLERLREVAGRLAAEEGLDLVVLFGSAARDGFARAEDVDIAVRGARPLDLIALTVQFIEALGTDAVDLADLRTADALLLALVARDGVVLYEGRPSAFAEFDSYAMRRLADTRKFREAEREDIADFLAEWRRAR